jgi:hypothetical protein
VITTEPEDLTRGARTSDAAEGVPTGDDANSPAHQREQVKAAQEQEPPDDEP